MQLERVNEGTDLGTRTLSWLITQLFDSKDSKQTQLAYR